ncbi:MAG TPA: Hsp20/alpha crystallin family protein, partial [Candidatus Acidoferrales bacterium]|nr:Hsp20/alpha crystallin family protein [Candidatus Acidoferrales bacterium]
MIDKRTVITGLIALGVGAAIGVGAEEHQAKAGKSASASSGQPPSTVASNQGEAAATWDPFQQIRDMQMQMDKLLSQMSAQFRSEPQFSSLAENPAYSLSLNVEDLKDRYIVHAFLPDAKASDVNVKLDNQTLKVEANNQQSQTSEKKDQASRVAEWGQYEQEIQLPTP